MSSLGDSAMPRTVTSGKAISAAIRKVPVCQGLKEDRLGFEAKAVSSSFG
jgi:hypothetical protein